VSAFKPALYYYVCQVCLCRCLRMLLVSVQARRIYKINNRKSSRKNTLEHATSTYSGFHNKQYFLVSLTESAASATLVSERCCYSTFSFVDKHTILLSFPSEDHIVGQPWCVPYLWALVIIFLLNSCIAYVFVENSKNSCRFAEVLNVYMVPKRCLNILAIPGYLNLTDTKRVASKSPSRDHPHKTTSTKWSNTLTYRCGRGGWSHALEPIPSPSA